MNTETKKLCDELLADLNEYSDCQSCGHILKDSTLLVPDPLNPGRFKSNCPSCNKESLKLPFPPTGMKVLFEMMVECAGLTA